MTRARRVPMVWLTTRLPIIIQCHTTPASRYNWQRQIFKTDSSFIKCIVLQHNKFTKRKLLQSQTYKQVYYL